MADSKRLTELGGSQNPFVEQDDTRTQCNPQPAPVLQLRSRTGDEWAISLVGRYARNVESRVKTGAGGGGIVVAALELAIILGRATVCHG